MVVSVFKNFNEVVENAKIIEVLNDIKTGKYINVITYLRKSLAEQKWKIRKGKEIFARFHAFGFF